MPLRLPPNLDPRSVSHVWPDSNHGRHLTKYARLSETIVETGTLHGLGTTLCLYYGLVRPTQRLISIEIDEELVDRARSYYDDPRVTFIWGTLVLPGEEAPYTDPRAGFEKYHRLEVQENKRVPYVLDQVPDQIDLLSLDGGLSSAQAEFEKLHSRCKWICLDDTNPKRESKNVRQRILLYEMGWRMIADELEERNGWCLFERP